MFTSDTLKGKTILITGGGSGLGLSMAVAFGKVGANLAICGRTPEKLEAARKEIEATGASVFTGAVDVRDYDALKIFVGDTIAHFGSVEGLVNNAAGNFLAPSEDISPNGFKSVVDIVLHGSFNTTQLLGNYWIKNGIKGSVLNIVTTYTETGSAFVLPSACAKAGVYAMTTTLAYEWGTYGIRLNAIAPGPFPTEGAWKRLIPDKSMEEFYKKQIPLGRFGEHEELSNLAIFVMSDLSPYLTGECINIDGGERLKGGQFNFIAQVLPREQLKAVFAGMRKK